MSDASEVTRAPSQLLPQVDIEQLDPRGRTPLHLATTLGHLECARVLLAHGADVGRENRSGWTGGHPCYLSPSASVLEWAGESHPVTSLPPPPVLQEAVSTRDLELVQLVLRYRDYQRVVKRLAGIPMLLEKLRKVRSSSPAHCGPASDSSASSALFFVFLQAQDFYVEMKWEFTSWGKRG